MSCWLRSQPWTGFKSALRYHLCYSINSNVCWAMRAEQRPDWNHTWRKGFLFTTEMNHEFIRSKSHEDVTLHIPHRHPWCLWILCLNTRKDAAGSWRPRGERWRSDTAMCEPLGFWKMLPWHQTTSWSSPTWPIDSLVCSICWSELGLPQDHAEIYDQKPRWLGPSLSWSLLGLFICQYSSHRSWIRFCWRSCW